MQKEKISAKLGAQKKVTWLRHNYLLGLASSPVPLLVGIKFVQHMFEEKRGIGFRGEMGGGKGEGGKGEEGCKG